MYIYLYYLHFKTILKSSDIRLNYELFNLFTSIHANHSTQFAYNKNLSGFIKGHFTTLNTSTSSFNSSILSNDTIRYGLNASIINTFSLSISSNETRIEGIHWIKGIIELNSNKLILNTASFASFRYNYFGVYLVEKGELYFTANDQ